MDRALTKYLTDILIAIEDIEYFVMRNSRQYSIFLSDIMFRSAVERKIGIIGEALNQALKLKSDLEISDARKIVGTRNYVIHAYDSLRPDMLWSIVINDLPLLKQEIESLLSE